MVTYQKDCSDCSGSGKVFDLETASEVDCPYCNGSGKITVYR